MDENQHNNEPHGSGFESLGRQARVDARMRKDGKPYTSEQAKALVQELEDHRRNTRTPNSKQLSWRTVAERAGIPVSTLAEIRTGRYRGDRQKFLRRIDDFLADERRRAGRFDGRTFSAVGITEKIFGVIRAAIKHNSMAVVIGDSGDGKSAHARAFAGDREGVVLIRVDEAHGDARGVVALLYRAFSMVGNRMFRHRLSEIVEYLGKNRNTVIVVDECQKLRADGLEVLRDIHDQSDMEGRRNVPMVFFGDHTFYKLIVRARNGEPGPIKPQMTRRMYPVLNLEMDGADGEGGLLYSADDIVRILRNNRLRVVTDDGVRWLASLANVRGYGSLGFSIAIVRLAFDICPDRLLSADDLRRALGMALGPKVVREVDNSAGGELLRAAM